MKHFIIHTLMCVFTCGTFHILDSKFHWTERLSGQLGIAAVEEIRKGSDYVTVDVLSCNEIRKTYYPDQLKFMPAFDKNLVTCGEIYSHLRLKKDLIRTYFNMYRVSVDKIYPDDQNPRSPLLVSEYNIPYCNLQTEKNPSLAISISCEEFEKKLNGQ